MEIRDILHGSISIDPFELAIIDSPYFQRLRKIKQLGFAEIPFPTATHNRFIHSIGAMQVASEAFDSIFSLKREIRLSPQSYSRFRQVVRLAALLHDIGHGPLSHTTEIAMPSVKDLHLPAELQYKERQATHEDYTLKMILDSGLTSLIERAGEEGGFRPIHVAALVSPKIQVQDSFFFDHPVDFRPILQQLISSELDADRMDYLRRDSAQTGVSYGQFDFAWLAGHLTSHIHNGKCYLALEHRALYALEDFLISRFHMFLMVYFHHKTVIYDEMLAQYFGSPDCSYFLPADIEEYCRSNDAQLYAHLEASSNPWAKRIIEKRPYRMLIELHSGIRATHSSKIDQLKLLAQIKKELKMKEIHSLTATSTSELSKYFKRPGDPIFVYYDNHYSPPQFIPLQECTNLFERYQEKRSITRLYVSPEDYPYLKG